MMYVRYDNVYKPIVLDDVHCVCYVESTYISYITDAYFVFL